MYLWVILATFIAILGSYNLSVRPDMDRIHAENKATVFIDKFRYQQNALKDYLSSLGTFQTGQTRVSYFPEFGINISSCSSNEGEDDENGENKRIGCYNEDADFTKHLPLGYNLPTGDTAPVSKVFCFTNENYSTNCTSTATESCCSDEYTGIFVISFQPIHSRWLHQASDDKYKLNTDLLRALTKIPGYGSVIGYTTTESGEMVISGGQHITKSVTTTDEDGNSTTTIHDDIKYQKIFPAVQNDADFKRLDCDEKPCLFAIKQIYD